MKKECIVCGEFAEHHAHGKCYTCYRKSYTQPKVICKECGIEKEHHSRGKCKNCIQKEYYYDDIKSFNVMKYHNISYELWKELTQKCMICGFDKVVELHHIDQNKSNTTSENLIGLCPNHHRMIHDMRYSKEIKEELNKKLKEKFS